MVCERIENGMYISDCELIEPANTATPESMDMIRGMMKRCADICFVQFPESGCPYSDSTDSIRAEVVEAYAQINEESK